MQHLFSSKFVRKYLGNENDQKDQVYRNVQNYRYMKDTITGALTKPKKYLNTPDFQVGHPPQQLAFSVRPSIRNSVCLNFHNYSFTVVCRPSMTLTSKANLLVSMVRAYRYLCTLTLFVMGVIYVESQYQLSFGPQIQTEMS